MLINKYQNKTFLLLLLFMLQACAPTLPVKVPKSKVKNIPHSYPDQFKTKTKSNTDSEGQAEDSKTEEESSANTYWKEYFMDPDLITLIDQAFKNNQELKILEQEINIADNEVMARRGEYLPRVGFGAGYESEKVGEYTSQGAADKTTEYEPGKFVPENLHKHRIGLTASWELDIWKKLRNSTKAAYANYLSSIEARKFVITKLVTEIANTYYELLALDNQKKIVDNYIAILDQAKEFVRLQQKAARVTSLAVKRFEAEVLKNQSRKYEIQQEIIQTENKLNFLVGRYPQRIKRNSKKFNNFLPKDIKVGLPSELLYNRPDVKSAALKVKASKLSLKAAKARFYPSLSIEAQAGYEAFNKEHLYDAPESIFYNLGVNLTAPLLNRNAIKADYFSANNKQIQAIYEYEKTVLNAYTEVVNQMSMIMNIEKIFKLKSEQVEALTKSVEVSGILFKAARVDYVEALLTQRDSLEAQVELVEIKKDQLLSYVSLYRALGGGWRAKEELNENTN